MVSDFPVVPVALAVAGVAAVGAILLSGPERMGVVGDYPATAFEQLTKIGDAIRSERQSDAYNFSQYQSKLRENYNLLEQERRAEIKLAEENRLWEAMHRNMDSLQAAQAAVDTISAQRATVKGEAEDYRQRVNRNAQNILSLREDASQIIVGLPSEFKSEGWKKIDPCTAAGPTAMKGAFLGEVRLAPRFAIVNI